jgi:hypothetical protein
LRKDPVGDVVRVFRGGTELAESGNVRILWRKRVTMLRMIEEGYPGNLPKKSKDARLRENKSGTKAENDSEAIYVRLPSDVLTELDVFCAKVRYRRPGVIAEAIVNWLSAMKAPLSEKIIHRGKLHDKLAEILASGDTLIIEAITRNIDVFHERLRPMGR